MKTLLAAIFGLMLISGTAFCQQDRTFYLVCGTNASLYPDFQRDEITVSTLKPDQIIFKSVGTTYTAAKVDGSSFMSGGKDMAAFVAYRVDENSFFIAPPGVSAMSYYHADKRMADVQDQNKRCAVNDLNQFEELVKTYNKKKEEADKQQRIAFEETGRKPIITKWVKELVSKRNDPALEKAIRASTTSPILHIVFLTPAFDFERNDLGIIQRKMIKTVYVYKWLQNGKCYAYWQYFGYESLGGGAFDTDVRNWRVMSDGGRHIAELNVPGTDGFPSGEAWEVDCSAFVR
jgi:hypothetical protein